MARVTKILSFEPSAPLSSPQEMHHYRMAYRPRMSNCTSVLRRFIGAINERIIACALIEDAGLVYLQVQRVARSPCSPTHTFWNGRIV